MNVRPRQRIHARGGLRRRQRQWRSRPHRVLRRRIRGRDWNGDARVSGSVQRRESGQIPLSPVLWRARRRGPRPPAGQRRRARRAHLCRTRAAAPCGARWRIISSQFRRRRRAATGPSIPARAAMTETRRPETAAGRLAFSRQQGRRAAMATRAPVGRGAMEQGRAATVMRSRAPTATRARLTRAARRADVRALQRRDAFLACRC